MYFFTNFFAGLSIGEIFDYLTLQYIKENRTFLGIPLGINLSQDKLPVNYGSEILKTKIKQVSFENIPTHDSMEMPGESTLRNIENLLKNQEKYIKDLEKLVSDNKVSDDTNLEKKLNKYIDLFDKTRDLRVKFLHNDISLKVSKKTASIVIKELKGLQKEDELFRTELASIPENDPNSLKKALDYMNKYKNAQSKTLTSLTELIRKDLKNLPTKDSELIIKNLNKFENAANSSQNELKNMQKELADMIKKTYNNK